MSVVVVLRQNILKRNLRNAAYRLNAQIAGMI